MCLICFVFLYKGQYKAVFLALHEAFKAEPVFQTKEEFLDTVSPMLKKSSAISSYIIREFEVWNFLRHVAELKAKVDVSDYIVFVVKIKGQTMEYQRKDD